MEQNKRKIVLCEDEKFVARSFVRKLTLEGYEVILVSNGNEAMATLVAEKPNLIILDLMMPGRTGFEVLQDIRASTDEDIKKIPVIVASNLGQKSDIETARSLGAVDFLIKSNISLKELAEKVREHLPI